jgi:hypothetical protein
VDGGWLLSGMALGRVEFQNGNWFRFGNMEVWWFAGIEGVAGLGGFRFGNLEGFD